APRRVTAEVAAAFPTARQRWQFRRDQLRLLTRAPLSPVRMAARAALIERSDVMSDCAAVSAPTLVIAGEHDLDHVVTVGGTHEYVRLIRNASLRTIDRTGHLGSLTRPDIFAAA